MTGSLDALEAQLQELLNVKVFDESVRAGSEAILAALPSAEEEPDTDRKVQILLLRCRARMLQPFVSKEAEKDIHSALKLKQNAPEMWVELSECLLRRNAFKEACDALDNALRIDPKNVIALCKYSQVQRNRCGEAGLTPAQKVAFLEDAVDKARLAVQANVDDADAWNTLALSLLSKATSDGMTSDGARKALSAMQQAEKKTRDDPDLYYNKAVLEGLVGNFGASANDFMSAHRLDSRRLKGTKRLCEMSITVLNRAISRIKNAQGMGKGEMKKMLTKLTRATPSNASVTCLAVVDVISEPSMQPLTLLAVDRENQFSIVLVYQVNSSAFKIGDVLTMPASTQRAVVTHDVPAMELLDTAAVSLTIPHYYAETKSLLVNSQPLPSHSRAPVQVSSRLFA